jgi:hypothetical protein
MRLVAEPRRNCANVHSKNIQLSRNNETLDFQKSADERETGGYVSYRPCVMEIHNLDRTKNHEMAITLFYICMQLNFN